uniref:Uncharacterized protein n=1 Tax=Anguilla anguilla TaxID=7936 RepID=A0A0E9VRE9_ANGAN
MGLPFLFGSLHLKTIH